MEDKKYTTHSSWLKLFSEQDGTLGVVEFDGLPFTPRRYFWLTEIDGDTVRANHAHRTCHQMLICLAGTLTATVTSINREVTTHRLTIGTMVYLPPFHWLELTLFSPDAVLGVLASEPYDYGEYITNRSEFFRSAK